MKLNLLKRKLSIFNSKQSFSLEDVKEMYKQIKYHLAALQAEGVTDISYLDETPEIRKFIEKISLHSFEVYDSDKKLAAKYSAIYEKLKDLLEKFGV